MSEFFQGIGSQLFIAAVTAFLTVRLSIRAFSTQRWWERKADAYASIVQALSHELSETWRLMDDEERRPGRETPDPTPEQENLRRDAQRRIQEAAATRAFIVSEEAAERLVTLRNELADATKENTYYEHLGVRYAALEKCIKALRDCAVNDLGVRRRRWPL